MKYWAHLDNAVKGPFEKEALAAMPGFTAATMVYPETPAGGTQADWKAASAYPELLAAMKPAPASAPVPAPEPARTPPPEEDKLMLTMRGSIIGDPAFSEPLAQPPAAAVPAAVVPAAAIQQAPAPQPRDPRAEQLRLKLDQLAAELAAVAQTQAQLAGRLEAAVRELKGLPSN